MLDFRPYQSHSAIRQITIAIEFVRPLTETVIRSFLEAARQREDEYPLQREKRDLRVDINVGSKLGKNKITGSSESEINGALLLRKNEKGNILRSVEISDDSIWFKATHIETWDEAFVDCKSIFETTLPCIYLNNEIKTFGISVQIEFYSDKSSDNGVRPQELFLSESIHLPQSLFNSKLPWDLKYMLNIKPEDGCDYVNRSNIIINATDKSHRDGALSEGSVDSKECLVSVINVQRMDLDNPRKIETQEEFKTLFDGYMKDLYEFSLKTFSNLFSEEASGFIS